MKKINAFSTFSFQIVYLIALVILDIAVIAYFERILTPDFASLGDRAIACGERGMRFVQFIVQARRDIGLT